MLQDNSARAVMYRTCEVDLKRHVSDILMWGLMAPSGGLHDPLYVYSCQNLLLIRVREPTAISYQSYGMYELCRRVLMIFHWQESIPTTVL